MDKAYVYITLIMKQQSEIDRNQTFYNVMEILFHSRLVSFTPPV